MAQNSFWSDASLEPKRAYRFRVLFNDNSAYTIKKVKNPAVTITQTPHKFLNHTFHYPGRAEWDELDVTFVDPSAPDQTLKLYDKLIKMGYRNPVNNEQSTHGFTKAAATKTIGDVRIQTLGPVGGGGDLDVIGQWALKNAFFTKISWGDFSYDDEGLVELSTTIRYDYAIYSGKNKEIGSFQNPSIGS